MSSFEAMLVREKIILTELPPQTMHDGVAAETTIRSTRLQLQLADLTGHETLVIRAQNMHTTLRIAAKLMFSFHKSGRFSRRRKPFDWQGMWDLLRSAYDRKHSPDLWAAVYIGGVAVFKTTYAPHVDIIEECAALTVDNYDATMLLTEKTLGHMGRQAHIEHTAKVAAVFTDDDTHIRCGVIQRSDGRDIAFNFTATGGEAYSRIIQAFHIAASFIEAIDIRHYMRSVNKKLNSGELTRSSPEMSKYYAGPQRLKDLRLALEAFEEHFEVRYRPERPDVFVAPRESA